MTQSAQQAIQNNTHPTLLPVIMPVHTVRNNTVTIPQTQQVHHGIQSHCNVPASQINSSHFTATNFQIRKSCSHRCSWKCLAIFLIFVTVLLTSALAYFGGKNALILYLSVSLSLPLLLILSTVAASLPFAIDPQRYRVLK